MGATPRGRVAWVCTCQPSPMPIEASPKGGSLPSTAASSGSASPVLRPWCNRNAASDMRNRWRAHGSGVFVHMHADVDVHARISTASAQNAPLPITFHPESVAPRPASGDQLH